MTHFAALILAAGQASRFRAAGGLEPTKLVALHAGETLVRRVARTALASKADPVVLVTGHARAEVEDALKGLPLRVVHNSDYAEGMSTSLQTGVRALPNHCLGVVILLGDMPSVDATTIDRLIDRATQEPQADAVVLMHRGQRGNPVLICRSAFPRIEKITGDMGARKLLNDPELRVVEVSEASDSIFLDVDEPKDLAAFDRPR